VEEEEKEEEKKKNEEEEKYEEEEEEEEHLPSCQSHVIFDVLILYLLVTYIFRIL
jgi:hypothetical protein